MSMLLLKTAGLVMLPLHNINFGWNRLSKMPNLNQMLLQFKQKLMDGTLLPKKMLHLLKLRLHLLPQLKKLMPLQLKQPQQPTQRKQMLTLKKPWMPPSQLTQLPKKLTLMPFQLKLKPTQSNHSSKHGLNGLIHT
jgi:hypothetical protein